MRRAGNAVIHDTAPQRKFRDRLIFYRRLGTPWPYRGIFRIPFYIERFSCER